MANAKLGEGLSSGGLSELKSRLLAVFIGIVVFRLGAYIPVPGVDPRKLTDLFSQHSGGLLGVFNMFSGGALRRMTIFALSIMPYISASIIVQLYTAISPQLKQLQKEGEQGKRKLNQYTRYGTLGLSLIQGFGICKWLAGNSIAVNPDFTFFFVGTTTLVTGTMFLMWLALMLF
jgi:preprotein translocase subunit SecY